MNSHHQAGGTGLIHFGLGQEAAAIYQAGAVAATGILGGASIAKNDEWIILMAGGAAKRIDPKLAMGERRPLRDPFPAVAAVEGI